MTWNEYAVAVSILASRSCRLCDDDDRGRARSRSFASGDRTSPTSISRTVWNGRHRAIAAISRRPRKARGRRRPCGAWRTCRSNRHTASWAAASRWKWRRRTGSATRAIRPASDRAGKRRAAGIGRIRSGIRGARDRTRRCSARLPSDDELLTADGEAIPAGPREAIETYKQILETYPNYERNDQVLYQMSRAYDEIGQPDEAMAVMNRFVAEYPYSRYVDEVQFRRGEYYFVRKKWLDAEDAYGAVTRMGQRPRYYELALYKLGWSLYKQYLYEEALHQFMAMLDYQLTIGYDFDKLDEEDETPDLRYVSCHQPEFLESRRSGRDRRVLLDVRPAQLCRQDLRQPRRVLFCEAALRRRRFRLQVVHRAESVSQGVAALQHARRRDLRRGRLPATGRGGEERVRDPLRDRRRVLELLRC